MSSNDVNNTTLRHFNVMTFFSFIKNNDQKGFFIYSNIFFLVILIHNNYKQVFSLELSERLG